MKSNAIKGLGSNKTVLFLTTVALLLLVYSIASNVMGGTEAVTASVTITDVAPTVSTVYCSGDISSEKTNYRVDCWAQVTDNNSYQDIDGCNGTSYYVSYAGAPDNDTRYHNSSCTESGGSGATEWCNCSYQFRYWADDGTWTARIWAWDTGVDSSLSYAEKSDQTITQFLGHDTGSSVSFGSLGIGDVVNCGACGSCDLMHNNTGNNPIDFQVASTDGTGTTNFSCSSMPSGSVNLSIGAMKYDASDATAYASCAGTMNETAAQTNAELSSTFNLADCSDLCTAGPPGQSSYWGISLGIGSGGSCSYSMNAIAVAS